MQEEQTGRPPSRYEVFVKTHKKKSGDYVEPRAEQLVVSFQTSLHLKTFLFNNIKYRIIGIFCLQATVENLKAEQARSQAESADTPLRSDDELMLEAAGGVYKSRTYGQGPLPPRPRSVYAPASSSSAVSQAEHEAVKKQVAELTLSQASLEERIQQQTQEVEQRLQQQFSEMFAKYLADHSKDSSQNK